jgi:hypothetical protein
MLKTVSVLLACASVSLGCLPHQVMIPDPRIPHRIAEEATVTVWVRGPDGKLVKQEVKAFEGWWLASPEVVGP